MVIVAELVKPLVVVQVIVGSSPNLHTNLLGVVADVVIALD